MRQRSLASKVRWLVVGLLASAACSNGASDSPSAVTPTPTDARATAPTKPVTPEQPPSKELPPAEASPDEAAPIPAPRTPVSHRPGDGERLNLEVAGLGTEVMLAAFPERVGAWTRSAANAHPAGAAGRWADGASATYRQDAREIRVDVTDMIRVNGCTSGTGIAILEESLAAEPGSRRVSLGKHPAVLSPTSPGSAIELWLGDRCQLGLSTADATGDELVALGSGLGLDALATACARRGPVGPLGR